VEIQPGETVVGRHDSCHVVLDDPLASRRHAALNFRDGRLWVKDLGSVNGLSVNDQRVTGERELRSSDQIRLGNQCIVVHLGSGTQQLPGRHRVGAQTLANLSLLEAELPNGDDESTVVREGEALETLALVAEKILSMGRGIEAERILRKALLSLKNHAEAGESVEPETLKLAADYAVRIAEATGKAEWIDYVFTVYASAGRVLPASVVDRLYSAVRIVEDVKLDLVRGYLAQMQATAAGLGPAERFLLRRIEGIERLVGL
jgi:hypothetical protein